MRSNERGQVLVLVGLSMLALLGFAAFVIDLGYVMYAQRTLQQTADAAATAGAMSLPDDQEADNVARHYSAAAGQKNYRPNLPGVAYSSVTTCNDFLVGQSLPCVNLLNKRPLSPTKGNLLSVTETATIPLMFARTLGISSIALKAKSSAGMRGGLRPLNIVVVVDTTASMNNADKNCGTTGVSGQTRLDCAKLGVRSLLGCVNGTGPCNLDPSVDSVGLMIFPGLKSSTPLSREYNCNSDITSSSTAAYNASPVYSIIPLSNSYRSGGSTSLNGAGSSLVKAIDWTDGVGCSSSSYGLESPGGQGTYYAGALAAAQASFPSGSDKQNVIILLSDGDASADTGGTHQCRAAVAQATNAANSGTWVYRSRTVRPPQAAVPILEPTGTPAMRCSRSPHPRARHRTRRSSIRIALVVHH